MTKKYSEAFKAQMVKRMCGPNAVTGYTLAEEVGIAPSTLYMWRRRASTVANMSKPAEKDGKAVLPNVSRRPQDFAPDEKLQVVLEAAALSNEELGEFLRRKGLREVQLSEWRDQVKQSAADIFEIPRSRSMKKSPEARRIRELEKELRRKDKALAETAALLVLKKKANAIWGDEDDDTAPSSEK